MATAGGRCITPCQKKPDTLKASTRACCCTKGVKNTGSRKFPSIALPRIPPSGLSFRNRLLPACVTFALEIARRGAALLVVGDETSTQFPEVLKEFRHRQGVGMRMNLLVNYGWEWDLAGLKNGGLRSDSVSRLDLIVRWGGGRRLSGFLRRNRCMRIFMSGTSTGRILIRSNLNTPSPGSKNKTRHSVASNSFIETDHKLRILPPALG